MDGLLTICIFFSVLIGLKPDDDDEEDEVNENRIPSDSVFHPVTDLQQDETYPEDEDDVAEIGPDMEHEVDSEVVPKRKRRRKGTGMGFHKCTKCSRVFRAPSNLRQHQMVHDATKLYSCDLCHKSYKYPQSLDQHKLKNHTSIREFVCNVCGRTFPIKAYLTSHQKVHMKIKPFQCESCPASFGNRTDLKVHYNKHEGKRPFACDKCPWEFFSLGALRTHKFVHAETRPWECDICGRTYKSKHSLNIHKNCMHSDVKKYECETCEEKFKYRPTMEQHQKLCRLVVLDC